MTIGKAIWDKWTSEQMQSAVNEINENRHIYSYISDTIYAGFYDDVIGHNVGSGWLELILPLKKQAEEIEKKELKSTAELAVLDSYKREALGYLDDLKLRIQKEIEYLRELITKLKQEAANLENDAVDLRDEASSLKNQANHIKESLSAVTVGGSDRTPSEFKDVIEDINYYKPENYTPGGNILTSKVSIVLTIITNIGMILAILMLAIIGIKYMLGSIEEKAEYKKDMIPYLVGACLLFGICIIVGVLQSIGNNINNI